MDVAKRETLADHTGLVGKLAGRLCSREFPYDELYAAGSLALIEAWNRFDDSRGVKFSTFATVSVRGQLLRYMSKERRIQGRQKRYGGDLGISRDRDCNRSVGPAEAKEWTDGMLECLTDRERLILTHYFGLYGNREREAKNIGDLLHIGVSRVHQIIRAAKEKIRKEHS